MYMKKTRGQKLSSILLLLFFATAMSGCIFPKLPVDVVNKVAPVKFSEDDIEITVGYVESLGDPYITQREMMIYGVGNPQNEIISVLERYEIDVEEMFRSRLLEEINNTFSIEDSSDYTLSVTVFYGFRKLAFDSQVRPVVEFMLMLDDSDGQRVWGEAVLGGLYNEVPNKRLVKWLNTDKKLLRSAFEEAADEAINMLKKKMR